MPGSIKIDDGSGNYTILTNAGSLGSDKTITIPNETGTVSLLNGTFNAQVFRLTTNSVNPGTALLTDWEAPDDTLTVNYGSLVSQSSGTFSFSETGYYIILTQAFGDNTSSSSARLEVQATNDNSTYDIISRAYLGTNTDNIGGYGQAVIKVTDTSNDKIQLQFAEGGTATLEGSSTINLTSVLFVKVGDV